MSSRIRTVERLRALAERLALGELARGQQEAGQAAQLVDERREMAAASATPPRGVLAVEQLRALHLQGLAVHDLVVDATAQHELAAERVQELQRAWSHACVQRKSVERLAEHRDAEAAAAALVAAQRSLDELAILRRERS